ncbi:hypothetical protein FOA52_007600 [Chlamydomonas sp. UWO 241]|nr:hypothetical protein FOA52_007600 [Chlamydomonas sp. UWO 241]
MATDLYRRLTSSFMKLGPVHDAASFRSGGGSDFKPTSNARNERMMEELVQFSKHLRKMQSGLMSLQNQVAFQFEGMRNVLVTPLPRVYDVRYDETDDHTGLVLATADQPHEVRSIGQGVALDKLELAISTMKHTMNDEVFRAMRQWEEAFQKACAHMKMSQRLRDELDAKRKRVEETHRMQRTLGAVVEAKREKQARKMSEGAPIGAFGGTEFETIGSKLAKRIQEADARVITKEEGVAGFADLYNRQEEITYKQLLALAKDAAALRNIAAEFMLNMRDCFDSAYNAFPLYDPLPYPIGHGGPGGGGPSPLPSRPVTPYANGGDDGGYGGGGGYGLHQVGGVGGGGRGGGFSGGGGAPPPHFAHGGGAGPRGAPSPRKLRRQTGGYDADGGADGRGERDVGCGSGGGGAGGDQYGGMGDQYGGGGGGYGERQHYAAAVPTAPYGSGGAGHYAGGYGAAPAPLSPHRPVGSTTMPYGNAAALPSLARADAPYPPSGTPPSPSAYNHLAQYPAVY